MSNIIELYYHDESEVDPIHSWLNNSRFLVDNAFIKSYNECSYCRVLALTEYARPDFILAINGEPILSAELTEMNPSGHNLPQRFSCLLRAAELGIPSLFYCPKYSRRTASDPNPRYINVRVALAQMRLSDIFGVPSLTMIWPTDPLTILPTANNSDHKPLADFVEYVAKQRLRGNILSRSDSEVKKITEHMKHLSVPQRLSDYRPNSTYRKIYPSGDAFSRNVLASMGINHAIDPPGSCQIENTHTLLTSIYSSMGRKLSKNKKITTLLNRENSFIYKGTANSNCTGPEHPYPGYLTLLDILYLRLENGQTTRERNMNLVFILPITLQAYTENAINRPTGLNILMEFADIIILEDAVVLGGWIRNLSAGAVLIRK